MVCVSPTEWIPKMPTLPMPSFQVISEARHYRQASLLLEAGAQQNGTQLLAPASMLAAYAIELYLKSFLVQDASVPMMPIEDTVIYYGALAVGENGYGHDLTKLYNAIAPDFRADIEHVSDEIRPGFDLLGKLTEYRHHFCRVRYSYELNSTPIIKSEMFELMDHLELICDRLVPRAYQPEDV